MAIGVLSEKPQGKVCCLADAGAFPPGFYGGYRIPCIPCSEDP